jgi:hypothetical protein
MASVVKASLPTPQPRPALTPIKYATAVSGTQPVSATVATPTTPSISQAVALNPIVPSPSLTQASVASPTASAALSVSQPSEAGASSPTTAPSRKGSVAASPVVSTQQASVPVRALIIKFESRPNSICSPQNRSYQRSSNPRKQHPHPNQRQPLPSPLPSRLQLSQSWFPSLLWQLKPPPHRPLRSLLESRSRRARQQLLDFNPHSRLVDKDHRPHKHPGLPVRRRSLDRCQTSWCRLRMSSRRVSLSMVDVLSDTQ